MTAKIIILSAFFISCNGLSIGSVSEENTKRSERSIGDAFPDWVPFKNKHGDELGEFVPVAGKSKIKKRLAPPLNFILRAVAEPEGDDYYDKQGVGDNDDNYENKDWSDINRPSDAVDNSHLMLTLNNTVLEDNVGIVNINEQPVNSIVVINNNARKIRTDLVADESDDEVEREDMLHETSTTEAPEAEHSDNKKNEDNNDYEDSSSEKTDSDPVRDISENEAKKAKILDAVDELKERHAEESRSISEKFKEDELYREEFERNRVQLNEPTDKYGGRKRFKTVTPDYDEYEDKHIGLDDKYKVNSLKKISTSHPHKTTQTEKSINVGLGQLSVFKAPQLYMVYDEIEETTTIQPRKFSARYNSSPSILVRNNDEERISLLPEDAKDGEPTLFLPVKRKSKKHKFITPETTTYSSTPFTDDTSAADTINDVSTVGTTPASTTADFAEEASSSEDTADAQTNADAVTAPASANYEKERLPETTGDYRSEKGGGQEHDSEHEEENEEHGKKTYKGFHEETKSSEGHHDKENHLGKYDDHGGVDKQHSEESGHYGDHQHNEHGKKHAKYEESGKHSKGHSTKGSHDVHKKEEYEKNVEFFEEEGDSAEEKKHGGFNQEQQHSEGGNYKKDNLLASHNQHSKGESGHYDRGRYGNIIKSHRQSAGHDGHGKNGAHFLHKDAKKVVNKWIYHHGYPAQTANLVVIDRRGDQMFHGPQYYG